MVVWSGRTHKTGSRMRCRMLGEQTTRKGRQGGGGGGGHFLAILAVWH